MTFLCVLYWRAGVVKRVVVVRVRNMTDFAGKMGISRQGLCKTPAEISSCTHAHYSVKMEPMRRNMSGIGVIDYSNYVEAKPYERIDLSIHNAIVFACRAHDKKYRKSTDIPYISHLMETMQILLDNKCSKEIVIAGILHDALEDTDTTPEEIKENFGSLVLLIVQEESEDKSLTWLERKQKTIEHMKTASIEVKLVCCADKLSNMRSIYTDLESIGEKVWERFNSTKENIKMYYEGIFSSLSDISDLKMYNELKELIHDVFYLDWSGFSKEKCYAKS